MSGTQSHKGQGGGDKSNLTITVLKKRGLWNQVVSHVESVWQVKNRTAC